MKRAINQHNGGLVNAEDASPAGSYKCPNPYCGARVYRPNVRIQQPHFRHYPGEGTAECEEYDPGNRDPNVSQTVTEVEDDPYNLGLLLTQRDSRWGLGLRLPEIPSEELGKTSLERLLSASVHVCAGQTYLLRIGAIELRPGVGVARVEVAPTAAELSTQPIGTWPNTVDQSRWCLCARGLNAEGTLFCLRRGEWTRLVAGSVVHLCETVLVLAKGSCSPPIEVTSDPLQRLSGGGLDWCVWEVQLPTAPQRGASEWLAHLGHRLVPRPWSVDLVTPPRSYGEGNKPIFWAADAPVLELEAPQGSAAAQVSFKSESEVRTHFVNVQASLSRVAHVNVNGRGEARLAVATEQSASINISFERQHSDEERLAQLKMTPRLKLQLGTEELEAWQRDEHTIQVSFSEKPNVYADLGVEMARASVTVWECGKRRTQRGLDARGVERAIVEAFNAASRVEIDADNLGRVIILLVRAKQPEALQTSKADSSRLAWRDEIVSLASQRDPQAVPTIITRPGSRALGVRRVCAASIVRSRLALRRRLETGGDSL